MERNGIFTGKGRFIYPNQNEYEGDFVNGLPEGKGRMLFPNHDRYEGYWSHGEMTKGEYLYYDKNRDRAIWKYEGFFQNSAFHGLGKMFYSNRTIYSGEWADGKRNGCGQQLYPSGDILSGIWENDTIIFGTYEFSDGSKYVGHFKDFSFCGYGTFFCIDGTIRQGEWRDKELISGAEYKPNGDFCKIEGNKRVIYD